MNWCESHAIRPDHGLGGQRLSRSCTRPAAPPLMQTALICVGLSGNIASMRAQIWTHSGALALCLLCGCSSAGTGGASCTSKGLCPNDTPPTPSEVSQCKGIVGDPKCGALFQAYLDCAFAQQKCASGGTLDDSATKAAIGTHCIQQAGAYRVCSGSTSPAPTCGYDGLPCCNSGPACASTACCDPSTNKCVGPSSACATASTICVANACEACGAPGQPCCPTFGMPQSTPCAAGGCCKYLSAGNGVCIAADSVCDAPDAGSAATVCHAGSCAPCGSSFGPCCPNNTCTESGNLCVASSDTCMPCGGLGLPTCP
jgi:hypothetical protein